jgi:hypothetical protein
MFKKISQELGQNYDGASTHSSAGSSVRASGAMLTLPYSSNLYHERVSPPLKKRHDMLSEGNASLPVGCDSPLQIVMAVWGPFCFNFNFLGQE